MGNKLRELIPKQIINWQPTSEMAKHWSTNDYDIIILSDYNKGVLNQIMV